MNTTSENQVYWDNYDIGMRLYQSDPILALLVGIFLLESNKNLSTEVFIETIFAFCAGVEIYIDGRQIEELEAESLAKHFLDLYCAHT